MYRQSDFGCEEMRRGQLNAPGYELEIEPDLMPPRRGELQFKSKGIRFHCSVLG